MYQSESRRSKLAYAIILTPFLFARAEQGVSSLGPGLEIPITYSLAGKQVPVWTGGGLVAIENNGGVPALVAFGKEGRAVFSTSFSVPESSSTWIWSYARGKDGMLALCGSAWAADGRGAPFLAWVSPDGVNAQIAQVGLYNPKNIVVAPDGTFWTVGREIIDGKESPPGVDRNGYVIRHFDREGKPLKGYIPRSEIMDPIRFALTRSYLVSSQDRVGWYSYGDSEVGEYIEVTYTGAVTRYPLPEFYRNNPRAHITGVAMTETGQVFVVLAPAQSPPRPSYLYTLDRGARQWRVVSTPPSLNTGKPIGLHGADGIDLVFQLFSPPRIALYRTKSE